tara:strand:+ start:318 stop:551 length:234 start_codon:yes stop_codon:yes gene_type:complete
MWWSKPKLTVEEMERNYVLEERTRALRERIAELNKRIGRDKEDKKELAKKVIEETPIVTNSQRDDELAALRAKLLKK